MLKSLVLAALTATAAHAAVVKIAVGPGLTFTPDSVAAAVGDVLEFRFTGGNHDAVLGDFSQACKPASPAGTGFASGAIAGSATNTNVFNVVVNSTEPLFYYCSVGAHCPNGMVGVVNGPASGDKTLAAYKAAAKGKTSTRPVGVYGGQFGPASA